jgi:hypothetical protein
MPTGHGAPNQAEEPESSRSPNGHEGDIMKKLLIGTALCALFAVPGWAGEPVELTSAQMDKVTAAGGVEICTFCSNNAWVAQANVNWSAFSKVRQTNVAVVKQEIN